MATSWPGGPLMDLGAKAFAQRLADAMGAKPEEFRAAEYRYSIDGKNWASKRQLERLVDGQWSKSTG